jgi:transcriptional regulator with XRE-family HTH domain
MEPANNGHLRPTVRCGLCKLNQFMTRSGYCRRCGYALVHSLPKDCAAVNMTQQSRHAAFASEFGVRVRLARESAGLSQLELAGRCKYHRTYIARIEGGFIVPGMSAIMRIARAVGMEFESLAFGIPPQGIDWSATNVKLLGIAIRGIRISRGMSQQSLARQVGICRDKLSRIECCKSMPRADLFEKIVDCLGNQYRRIAALSSVGPCIASVTPAKNTAQATTHP